MFYLSYTLSILSSFMTYHRVCSYHYTTAVISGAGTAYPSGAPEFTPGCQWSSCYSIFSCRCNVFVNRCLSICTFSFRQCVFDLWILITPLVSSNSSSMTRIDILGLYFGTNATHRTLKFDKLLKALSSITDMPLLLKSLLIINKYNMFELY
jgi:hypothetical protein